MNRKLALKREVLTELADADLRGLAGGQGGTETCASCLTYVSCYITDCIGPRITLRTCLAIDDPTVVNC